MIALITKYARPNTGAITPDTALVEALDDIDRLLSLPLEIEERTGIPVPDGDVLKWATVGDVSAWIERRVMA